MLEERNGVTRRRFGTSLTRASVAAAVGRTSLLSHENAPPDALRVKSA
jgi:hypothetical protein